MRIRPAVARDSLSGRDCPYPAYKSGMPAEKLRSSWYIQRVRPAAPFGNMGEIALIVINDAVQVPAALLPQKPASRCCIRQKLAQLATVCTVTGHLTGTPIILWFDRWLGGTSFKVLPTDREPM